MMRKIAMWLLPYYAGARLPASLRKWMTRELQSDPVLAMHYATLRRVERKAALHDGLSDAQRKLICANLFDSLERVEVAEVSGASTAEAAAAPRAWALGLPALGFAVAAMLVFVLVPDGISQSTDVPASGPLPTGEFHMRGANPQPLTSANAALGMRVRCLVGNAIVADAVVGARQAEQRLDCQPGGLLAFSGTNLSTDARYVFAVGLGTEEQLLWLPPFTENSDAVLLPAQSVDEALSHLTPMSLLQDDVATLLVVFSEQPFSGMKLRRQLGQLQRSALPLSKMERLPLDYPVQARVKVRKIP